MIRNNLFQMPNFTFQAVVPSNKIPIPPTKKMKAPLINVQEIMHSCKFRICNKINEICFCLTIFYFEDTQQLLSSIKITINFHLLQFETFLFHIFNYIDRLFYKKIINSCLANFIAVQFFKFPRRWQKFSRNEVPLLTYKIISIQH